MNTPYSTFIQAIRNGLCALALLVVWTFASADEAAQINLPRVRIQVGMHLIEAQVAQTPSEMATGLMHRKTMPTNEGMLFVYPQRQALCFWMKNTLIPLTIAFLDDDGTLLQTADMEPQSLSTHCSKAAVRYALEMNQGWFKQRGIKVGTKLHIHR